MESIKDIPEEILLEIYHDGKSYPEYFTEKVKEEILKRGLDISPSKYSRKKYSQKNRSILDWVTNNEFLAGLTFLTAIASGIIGFFVVISTAIMSINSEDKQQRIRIWRYFKVSVLTINLILILITYLLFNAVE